MKRILAFILALAFLFSFASCGKEEDEGIDMRIAMVTDYGNVDDHSFNQTTYEACIEWAKEHDADFTYYRPREDTAAARIARVQNAIDDGYNIIVLPGSSFSDVVLSIAAKYPNVKFIAIDVEIEQKDATKNVYCAIYHEEICGYLAGYAAVRLGYKNLGFVGGKAVPAVVRYGYGFVQGADAAAKELNEKINMEFGYVGQFYADEKVTAKMNSWYDNGTEVVFTCGGAIWTSVAEAAKAHGGKIIGVDVDQKEIMDSQYGEGITLTSAMKGIGMTVTSTLDKIHAGLWPAIAGHVATLGIISGRYPDKNYVGIPMESTQFEEGKFTLDDYKSLINKIYTGELLISSDTSQMPELTNTHILED